MYIFIIISMFVHTQHVHPLTTLLCPAVCVCGRFSMLIDLPMCHPFIFFT